MARYGTEHRRLRAEWAPLVDAGLVTCWRCHEPIEPGEPWDLGHGDGAQRNQYRGPEHRGRCNRATRTHAAQARKRTPRKHPSDMAEGGEGPPDQAGAIPPG